MARLMALENRLNTLSAAEIGPRWQVDDALLNTIAQMYGLPDPLEWRDLGGTYNLNLLVRGGDREIVVRVHRPWVTRARLLVLHDVRGGLEEQGFPVPEPLRNVHDETTWRYTDRWLEAAPFVPNDGCADTWERYGIAFSMLGRLHDAIDAHGEAVAFVPPRVSNYALPAALLPWLEEADRTLEGSNGAGGAHPAEDTLKEQDTPKVPESASVAHNVYRESRDLARVIADWWDADGYRLPEQAVHGDYTGDNLLIRGSEIVAILDFDFLAVRERIFDIALALYWIFGQQEGGMAPEEMSWRRAADLLARYDTATSRPLSLEERDALPYELARVPLYGVAEASFAPDPAASMAARAGGVRFARWVLDHRTDVAAILSR